jgi:phage-related protein
MPEQVRRDIGQALYTAQQGVTDPAAKALKGFGGTRVMEIVERHRGDAYRAVYTAHLENAVYVLHVFQKKSKTRIATPKHEIDVIRKRYAEAAQALQAKAKVTCARPSCGQSRAVAMCSLISVWPTPTRNC